MTTLIVLSRGNYAEVLIEEWDSGNLHLSVTRNRYDYYLSFLKATTIQDLKVSNFSVSLKCRFLLSVIVLLERSETFGFI